MQNNEAQAQVSTMSDNPDLPVHIEGFSQFTLMRVQNDGPSPTEHTAQVVLETLWVASGHPNEAIVLFRFAVQPDENTTENPSGVVIPDIFGQDVLITSYEIRTGMVVQNGGFIAPAYIVDAKEWRTR